MRYFLLSLAILCTANSFAQDPDPRLFQTWYLYKVQQDAFGDLFNVPEIDPAITPTLTLSENMEYTGQGACNTFSGSFEVSEPTIIDFIEFSPTTNDCGIPLHNDFEDEYFNFIIIAQDFASYLITDEGNHFQLHLNNIFEGDAYFRNTPLGIEDLLALQTKVFPNPSQGRVSITAPQPIQIIQVMDLHGRQISQTPLNRTQQYLLDLEQLTNGLYFVRLEFEGGTQITKKVILQK